MQGFDSFVGYSWSIGKNKITFYIILRYLLGCIKYTIILMNERVTVVENVSSTLY